VALELYVDRGNLDRAPWAMTSLKNSMAVNPIGILGFAVIMAVTSALITDERLKQLNSFINGI
ncbi:colicin-like pore-forming protein, partial [Escherichia coli]|nr:colicin-like pore-forming protein [Escherichia coli]